MNKQEIIKLWKELQITQINFEFSCGGDSMNHTQLYIETKNGNIENSEISDYFEDEIYKNVEFYVNSDGYYQGESGNVYITLSEEDEDQSFFEYDKQAQSEFEEEISETVDFELTQEETDFINNYIHSFGKGMFNNVEINWNYKKDFIITEKLNNIMIELSEKLDHLAINHEFYTNLDLCYVDNIGIEVENPIEIKNNILNVTLLTRAYRHEYSY